MKKRDTVTIGIPTYEAGESLLSTIESIGRQTAYQAITEILIVVDGKKFPESIARRISDPKVRIVLRSPRQGQSARINDLCMEASGDVLILTNDDVVVDDKAVENLLKVIHTTDSDFVSGSAWPLPAQTFFERVLFVSYQLTHTYIHLYKGDTFLSCNGRLLALRKSFYSKVKIPKQIWNNDAYLYLFSQLHGYRYNHAEKATVFFQAPQILREYLRQTWKFQISLSENQRYFSQDISPYYAMDKLIFIRATMQIFLHNPVYTCFYFSLLIVSRVFSQSPKHTSQGFWETDGTTKVFTNKNVL